MTKTVKKSVRGVKTLHVLMTLVWPVLVVIVVMGGGYLQRRYQRVYTPYYNPLAMSLLLCWLIYVYFILVAMRNYNLRTIATQECDFDAYLECMKFLEKFQFPGVRRSQRVNCTEAYLLMGDFDAAYHNLMEIKPQYERLNNRARMVYDYFWCRFYAELEDTRNFHICMDAFRNNWIHNIQVKRRLQAQAMTFLQELNFRDMIFAGKNDMIKADMLNLYAAGRLGSRYEFVRYCYYMGRLEYNMNNLQEAKHWFAQTVSFGLHEYMSKRAADFLAMLDAMQVPYAAVPPAHNQYYCNRRSFNMTSGIISILIGLILALVLLYI
ncbi:MAG: hypothetical protein HDQ96_12610 [Lachnospiraceae bacterium]|nr:hypothetical protein [Lachnospiraceae bacterium]